MIDAGSINILQALLILAIFLAITACIVFLKKVSEKFQFNMRVVLLVNECMVAKVPIYRLKLILRVLCRLFLLLLLLILRYALVGFLSQKIEFFKGFVEWFSQMGVVYNALEFILIIFFSFFYTALVFNPEELAENIKKSGGFIPGIRPGKKTALFFQLYFNSYWFSWCNIS